MQKHKHGSNTKTKENPSPALGLQGEDSTVSSVETCGRRVRRQRGQWGGSLGRDGGSGDMAAAQQRLSGDRERGAQPQFCERRDQCSPGPVRHLPPRCMGALTASRHPARCQGAWGQLLRWSPPQPAHGWYSNTALFSPEPHTSQEVCSPPAPAPTSPLHPLTSPPAAATLLLQFPSAESTG